MRRNRIWSKTVRKEVRSSEKGEEKGREKEKKAGEVRRRLRVDRESSDAGNKKWKLRARTTPKPKKKTRCELTLSQKRSFDSDSTSFAMDRDNNFSSIQFGGCSSTTVITRVQFTSS